MLCAGGAEGDGPWWLSAEFETWQSYVGHAWKAEDGAIGGSVDRDDALIAYRENGMAVAFASIGRDLACLRAERALETDDRKTMTELTAT